MTHGEIRKLTDGEHREVTGGEHRMLMMGSIRSPGTWKDSAFPQDGATGGMVGLPVALGSQVPLTGLGSRLVTGDQETRQGLLWGEDWGGLGGCSS